MLIFNKELHEYRWNSVVVPALTKILSSTGITTDYSNVNSEELENAKELGNNVHLTTALWETGNLAGCDEICGKCLNQWINMRKSIIDTVSRRIYDISDIDWIPYIEVPAYSSLGFACTPDRVYISEDKKVKIVVEIKTSNNIRGADIQTAGQSLCMVDTMQGFKKTFRFTAQLRWDEPGTLIEYTSKIDTNIFVSALNIYKWKVNRGYL
jgi:hypothetical protein